MQNLPIGTRKNERPPKYRVNQASPYSVNPSREFETSTFSEKTFHRIPVDLRPGFKTLAVVQDEARVRR